MSDVHYSSYLQMTFWFGRKKIDFLHGFLDFALFIPHTYVFQFTREEMEIIKKKMKKIKTQNKPQKSKKKYFFQKTTKTKKTQNVEIRKTYMYLLFFVYSYMYLWIERKRGQQLWKKISIYIDNGWCIIYKSLGDITKDTIAIELSEPWRVKNKRLEKELLQSRREKCLIEFSHPWK